MAVTGCRFNSEIPRIPASDLSEEDFNLNYFKQAKPVIITGATTEWPAIRSWTISSLMEKVGNNEVLIRGKVNKDEYRSGKAYTIRKDTFYNYCSDILSDNARAKSSYLAVASLQQAFPQLLDDVPLPVSLKIVLRHKIDIVEYPFTLKEVFIIKICFSEIFETKW